jgi:hypothetical protein
MTKDVLTLQHHMSRNMTIILQAHDTHVLQQVGLCFLCLVCGSILDCIEVNSVSSCVVSRPSLESGRLGSHCFVYITSLKSKTTLEQERRQVGISIQRLIML